MSLNIVGNRYKNFIVKKVVPIEELKCTLKELEHIPSKAQIMHIENDDPENLFCLSFQTLPQSSNGAAHVLEHTVLCGSEKFPVKDPFFAMRRRSLNTFMNAMTGSDFTCYPAASQMEKDFYNLLEVYIDAVFHPELKKMSFLQEGVRLEFKTADDPQTPLEYKGIVYNEMKGSTASPDSRLWHGMMARLLPDTPYAFSSGGDPKVIPQLTYEELKAFHETYYHPSRCLFFFYGNFPLEKHLDFISEKILKNTKATPSLPLIPRQKRFNEPREDLISFPVLEEQENKAMVAWGYLTVPTTHQEELLALSVLDAVLMDTDASLLRHALLSSGLTIQADAYMDSDMNEVPYLIVCKGCELANVDPLEKVIEKTLGEIVEKGIPSSLIEAAIHQLEITGTEITGDHAPFGLTLFMRAGLSKQHGSFPENALKLHSLFEGLRQRVKDPKYLPGILNKYLFSNPHRVRLLLKPDPDLASKELEHEKNILADIKASLSKEKAVELVKEANRLSTYQKEIEHQSLDCLPKVDLKDIPRKVREFPLEQKDLHSFTVFHHPCFTNQIVYADLIFDLPKLGAEELLYIPLFSFLLTEIGAADRDWVHNLEATYAHTGGFSASPSLHLHILNPHLAKPTFSLRGKALHRNMDKLFLYLQQIVESPRFDDKKRIKELILQVHNNLENRLTRNAIRYAISLSLKNFGMGPFIQNLWGGLDYYYMIRDLSQDIDEKLPAVLRTLETLKEKLLLLKNPHLVLSCDERSFLNLDKENYFDLKELPGKSFIPWENHTPSEKISSQGRPISSSVAFTSMGFKTIEATHADSPALSIAPYLMENKVLHQKIREQGGAYGAGASYNLVSGTFHFYSYRDPVIQPTLQTFEEAIIEIASGEFTDQDLEEAKLNIIQGLDLPVAPGTRALTSYAWEREGKTVALRRRYREDILNSTPSDVAKAVKDHLLPQKAQGVIVSFASKELIEKENHSSQCLRPLPIVSL